MEASVFIPGVKGALTLCPLFQIWVPFSWQIAPVMNSLFPGMTVENVLNSQMAQLAKLELSRMIESGHKASHPQNIVV